MKATFNQRELGIDFDSYANGLRAALRQAPKVILVGEMRDRETVKIALSAAETGHLVLSTLHTINAGETINRILGMFEPEEQEQIRIRLADSLRWVVSQRLCPKSAADARAARNHGLQPPHQETIRLGESEGKTFYEIIEASYTFGWRTFDQACLEAYEQGSSPRKPPCSIAPNAAWFRAALTTSRRTRGESPPRRLVAHEAGVRRTTAAPPVPVQTEIKPMPGSFDFISTEDKPALIAFSTPEWLETAKVALQELGYKVHTAATHSDFLVRFSQVRITRWSSSRNCFGANTIEENLTLRRCKTCPSTSAATPPSSCSAIRSRPSCPWKPSSTASMPSSTAPKCSCSSSSSKRAVATMRSSSTASARSKTASTPPAIACDARGFDIFGRRF
jgi:hypothetical protein